MKKLFFLIITIAAIQGCKTEKTEIIQVLSPQEVYDNLYVNNNGEAQLVDVRTEEEYEVSHLKDAQNICVTNSDFEEKVKTLDKNKPVYVYCKKGGRSAKAAKILGDLGFKKVYDLQGGITNWEANKLHTEK